MNKKRKIVIGGIILCGFMGILIYAIGRDDFVIPAPFFSFPAETPALAGTAAQQQTIDTGLSLTPSSSLQAITSPPYAAYSGCKLNLAFGAAENDASGTGNIHYQLVAKNIGNAICISASLSVYYANNESFVSAAPDASVDGYYWRFGDLAPGKEIAIALTTDRDAGGANGSTANEACLSAANGADACGNSSISFVPPSGQEFGTWVWTPPSEMTPDKMRQVVDEAAANHFNAIYITVDEYLDIATLQDGAQKQKQLEDYHQTIFSFLTIAAQKGISVDAEAGWRDWGNPENQWKALAILAFVKNYNASHAAKFRGAQYDIEPYLLGRYNDDKSGVLADYVTLIELLAQKNKDSALPLTIVVPHFYDANEGWTPQVTVNGVTDYTFGHIIRILNGLENGRVIIMAYRNFSSGSDGTIGLSRQEVRAADNSTVKIIVAQETGPVQPSYVTFHGLSRDTLFAQIASVNQAFASNGSFGGIAIDYLDTFLNLP